MCNISNLGATALLQIQSRVQGAKNLLANDLKSINTNGDKTISLEEMKVAVANAKGVKPEEIVFSEQDIKDLTEDAKDLTSFIRRGGELSATTIDNVNVFSFKPQEKLNDIRVILKTTNEENPITLSKGQSDPAVRQLKILINNLNVNNPNFVKFSIDPKDPNSNKFDDRLFEMVKKFQSNPNNELLGKVTEGVVDKATLDKLIDETNNIIKDDVFVPFVPRNEPIVPISQKEKAINEVREKIYTQLIAKLKTIPEFKDMTDEQLKQIIQEKILPIGKNLYNQNDMVITEAEGKTGWTSNGYCASGVKEAMERELNIPYLDGNATDLDTVLRKNFGDVFAELKLSKEDIMNLPPEMGVVVVHEKGGKSKYGHIGVYTSVESPKGSGNFIPSQLSDKERGGFSYPTNKFSVFIPLKTLGQGDSRFVSDNKSFENNSLEGNIRSKKHEGMKRLTKEQIAERKERLQGYNPATPIK
ncbi:MAG: hypothetical protein U0354_00610 [Candidatus Sericytochromatia bacterium]